MESLIVSVVFFYLSCVRGDEFGQQTSSCSQNWSNWGPCAGRCHDTTTRWRYRSVWRNDYGNGSSCPSDSQCQRCYVDSKACKINGTCYAHLQRQSSTGNGTCQECNRLISRDMWTPVSGGLCNDTQPCTKDGTACKSCETCNGTSCILKSGYCLINSQCYINDEGWWGWWWGWWWWGWQPYQLCLSCQPNRSTTQWTMIPARCIIDRLCYNNNTTNPWNQCQYCNANASSSSWTNYAEDTNCNDGRECTRNDHCDAGTCVGQYSGECAGYNVSTDLCAGTFCNGSNCLLTYYLSSHQCYAKVDQCDYPDVNCEGNKTECRYCTGGSCVSVHPYNTPKPTTGVNLSTAQIFVYKSGTKTLLSLKQAPDGVKYLMITDNKAIKIKFQNFKVPCDKVTIDWRLVTAVGETNVFPQQTVTTTSAGTVDVTVTNQFTLTNGAKHKIKVTAKNVRSTASTLDSSLILVDITNPVIGVIYDGDRPQPNQLADITYQMSNTRISAHWNPYTVYDSESGLETTNTYQIAVGTSPLSTNTEGYVTVQADSGGINASLQHNATYYVTLRVYNRAGLVSTKSSNGVKVDVTNPVTGTLTIVKSSSDHTQMDYVSSSTRQLMATLKGCNDPESGIIEIRWTVCAKNVNNSLDTACNSAGYQVYSSCSDPSDCVIDISLPQNDRILPNGEFQSGYLYDLRLVIKNGALRTSSVTSNKFVADYNYRPTCNCTSVSLFCAVLVDIQGPSFGSNAMLVKPVTGANATCLNRNLWENESSLVNFGGNSWNDAVCEVSSKSFAVQQGFTEMDLSELPCLLHSPSPTCPLEVKFVEHLYKKPNGRLGIRTTDLSTVNETIDSLRSAPCDCEQEVLFRWLQGHIKANTSRCTWKGDQLLLSLTINGDKCGLLRAPTHGRVSCSSPASSQLETCTVQCDHGFGLRSSSVQVCDPVVGWSFNATGELTCNQLRCIPII